VGVDEAEEPEMLKGRKKPKDSFRTHPSAARCVGRTGLGITILIIVLMHRVEVSFQKEIVDGPDL
jgi:hypothetical protein